MYIAAHFCRHFLGACQVSSAKLLPLLKMIVGCSNLEVLLSTPGQRTNSWKAHYAFLGKVSKSVCEKCSFLYRGQVKIFHWDRHSKGSFLWAQYFYSFKALYDASYKASRIFCFTTLSNQNKTFEEPGTRL